MRKTPITLGILSIVFGSLLALSSVFALIASLGSSLIFGQLGVLVKSLPQKPGHPDAGLILARQAELLRQLAPYNDALSGGKLALSIALIVIGCGMYRRRRWSRTGALGWSVLALLFAAIESIVKVSIIVPRSAALMQDMIAANPMMPHDVQSFASIWSVLMTLLFYAPFPLVLLALCGRRSASNDFTE